MRIGNGGLKIEGDDPCAVRKYDTLVFGAHGTPCGAPDFVVLMSQSGNGTLDGTLHRQVGSSLSFKSIAFLSFTGKNEAGNKLEKEVSYTILLS